MEIVLVCRGWRQNSFKKVNKNEHRNNLELRTRFLCDLAAALTILSKNTGGEDKCNLFWCVYTPLHWLGRASECVVFANKAPPHTARDERRFRAATGTFRKNTHPKNLLGFAKDLNSESARASLSALLHTWPVNKQQHTIAFVLLLNFWLLAV